MLKIHYALQSTLGCYIMFFENAGAEFSATNEKFGNNIHRAKSYFFYIFNAISHY